MAEHGFHSRIGFHWGEDYNHLDGEYYYLLALNEPQIALLQSLLRMPRNWRLWQDVITPLDDQWVYILDFVEDLEVNLTTAAPMIELVGYLQTIAENSQYLKYVPEGEEDNPENWVGLTEALYGVEGESNAILLTRLTNVIKDGLEDVRESLTVDDDMNIAQAIALGQNGLSRIADNLETIEGTRVATIFQAISEEVAEIRDRMPCQIKIGRLRQLIKDLKGTDKEAGVSSLDKILDAMGLLDAFDVMGDFVDELCIPHGDFLQTTVHTSQLVWDRHDDLQKGLIAKLQLLALSGISPSLYAETAAKLADITGTGSLLDMALAADEQALYLIEGLYATATENYLTAQLNNIKNEIKALRGDTVAANSLDAARNLTNGLLNLWEAFADDDPNKGWFQELWDEAGDGMQAIISDVLLKDVLPQVTGGKGTLRNIAEQLESLKSSSEEASAQLQMLSHLVNVGMLGANELNKVGLALGYEDLDVLSQQTRPLNLLDAQMPQLQQVEKQLANDPDNDVYRELSQSALKALGTLAPTTTFIGATGYIVARQYGATVYQEAKESLDNFLDEKFNWLSDWWNN